MARKYHTRQGDMIEGYLRESDGHHFTLEEASEKLRESGVGRSTVYRYLEELTKQGRVRKIATDERAVCYQYAESGEECAVHFHLICTACGKLLHLECEHLQEVSGHLAKEHQFAVDMGKTQFYGCCANCRRGKEG